MEHAREGPNALMFFMMMAPAGTCGPSMPLTIIAKGGQHRTSAVSPTPLTEDNRAADAQERHPSEAAELGVVARDVANPAHDGKDGAERQEAVVVPTQRGEGL